jgi:asparagine synthase (glutamine-hydrolysing)
MCGIAGFIAKGPKPALAAGLDLMLERISRRGPDGVGTWAVDAPGDYRVFFGHRRLAIIDVEGGHQPMHSQSTRNSIVFNGEIFNFQELAKDLRAAGVGLQTRSDTEVLLESLGREGAALLARLNGMFAFGFWNESRSELLLARDRLGIKPLYYVLIGERGESGIAFASELTALLAFSGAPFDRSLDPQGISDFFFHDSIPAPFTAVRGIRKLAPGESLRWRAGAPVSIEKYWTPSEVPVDRSLLSADEGALCAELLASLRGGVARQMISDVPVGVFLSGGIDSSVIAALATEHQSSAIDTFSIGFEEKSFDESEPAKRVADFLGARHHVEILSEAKMVGALEETLDRLDEPMGDASILPTYQVAKLARRHVKVCLGGDGGDELFAGYSFYGAHAWGDRYAKVPSWIRASVIHPLVSCLPVRERYQSLEWKAKRFTSRFDDSRLRRHFRWLAATDLPELMRFLPGGCPPSAYESWNESDAMSLDALLRLDLGTYLPGSVLTKVDRATMGAGVEARPPFLDNEVMEFALRLPSEWKLRGNLRGQTTKYLLKKATASLLPEQILNRPKQGFSVPISRWIRGELRSRIREAADSSLLFRSGALDPVRFQEILKEHEEFRRDWGKTLWSFLVLDHWVRANSKLLSL